MAIPTMSGNEDDKRRCAFLARYKKIGSNQWIRTKGPEIDISDRPWPEIYRDPQVEVRRENEVEIRVVDDAAVDLAADSLLGSYGAAAKRCNGALLLAFPGSVIVDSLSDW